MHKNKVITIGVTLGALLLFIGYSIYVISQPSPLEIQGQVEATQIKVGSKLPGRIDSLLVTKGQQVNEQTLLYVLSSPEVDAKLMQAEAAKEAAQAQNTKASNGARSEDVQSAYNVWQKAKAASEYAQKSFERINNLYNDGVVPEQKKDEIEMKMKAAIQTEYAAESVYKKAKTGARIEDKIAANALVKRADGAVTEVNSYLKETHIYAPRRGEIANIIAEEGELIASGYPVVTIVDLDQVWITFNVREDLLSNIRKGSHLKAKIPAMNMKEVELEVSYIHALGDFATWTATKTKGDFDMKTFEIHAKPINVIDGLRPGMSALVNWDELGDI